MFKLAVVVLAVCVCASQAGYLAGGLGYGAVGYGGLGYGAVGYAAAPAVSYAAPAVSYAAPAVTYAAPAVAYAAPVVVDNTHFSYGYLNPYANGHVSAARDGPIASHSYTFRAGTKH